MHLLIVSPDAYSLFDPDTAYPFGGAELRSWKFAVAIAKKNVRVSVITADQGSGVRTFGQVTVYPHPSRKGEGYWKRFRKPVNRIIRKLGLGRKENIAYSDFLARIHPDVVMTLGIGPEAVSLLHFCRAHNVKFIFGCASDLDLDPSYKSGNVGKDRSGNDSGAYHEVFEQADAILVQTPDQQLQLEAIYGRTGNLLFNPVDLKEKPADKSPGKVDLLWVGKDGIKKRPELFIELAELLPELKCRMIVNGKFDRRGLPTNVELLMSVPFEKMDDYFSASRLFVSTSPVEGFANTFLQAAKHGVPVLSMNSDPNEMISKHKAGILAGNEIRAVADQVTSLLNDETRYADISRAAKNYVRNYHDEEKIMQQLFEIIADTVEARSVAQKN
jgi:glycosyltransferase involved in cell wall biosynthesis